MRFQEEIRAVIGLMYARGLLGQSTHRLSHLYSDTAGHPVFSATMSRDRWAWLMHNLRCDTTAERDARWSSDRFAAVRPIFELLNDKLSKLVIPSEHLTIDETLYPMRHQINFRQYNPSKPAKYGVLFRSINEARFPFTYKVFLSHL